MSDKNCKTCRHRAEVGKHSECRKNAPLGTLWRDSLIAAWPAIDCISKGWCSEWEETS